MDRFSLTKLAYAMMQFTNFLILLLGIALLGSTMYLWILVESFNSFILVMTMISSFFIATALLGIFSTKKSPCLISIYQFVIFVMLISVVVASFFFILEQDKITEYLTSKMEDSTKAINEARKAINFDMQLTQIILVSFAGALV